MTTANGHFDFEIVRALKTGESSTHTPRMKLYEIREMKGIDSLMPIEREQPKAGPGEVLIRVHAVSLNFRDLAIARGRYGRALKLPLVPMSDGAGEIVETGVGVSLVNRVGRVARLFIACMVW